MQELKEIQLSQLSVNFQSTIKSGRTEKNYILRYHEILQEAKDQFVQDLGTLQQELQKSRKAFIQLHKEKLDMKNQIAAVTQAKLELTTEVESLKGQLKNQQKLSQKQKDLAEKLESEQGSFRSLVENLEQIKEAKEQQIMKMTEELKY